MLANRDHLVEDVQNASRRHEARHSGPSCIGVVAAIRPALFVHRTVGSIQIGQMWGEPR
ncbi:predicted protein [Plenodomus lingam JN3]|uniref:Predicted protein n=1 Tax=Leptosphaeria maculans (strain JN3 / isolate v23.1.3 / race Av1-4-5-6-7-8) TaxID=985895 RepID=E5R4I4_LEPMJ|nr:predicted protein [Plenodomus lingam JN3]CBX91952.1 predicted protein [Plenodomus lingam JN3]